MSKDKILITTSGSANEFLEYDELVLIDFEGNLVEGNKKPSSEKMLHIEYYKQRPEINYILHMHSPYLSTFAACKKAQSRRTRPSGARWGSTAAQRAQRSGCLRLDTRHTSLPHGL